MGGVLALTCARAGYDVIMQSDGAETPDETLSAIVALDRKVVTVAADLTDSSALEALAAAAPGPVTLLVTRAAPVEDDRIQSLVIERLDSALATTLRAPLLLSKMVADSLPADREGLIVNVMDRRVWRPSAAFFSDGVGQAALWAASQVLVMALAPRIRVNAIGAPGPVDGAEDAEGLAAALTYLIGARSVTGQIIHVGGGRP
jgi:short-subunit dehydrogenase